MARPTDTSAVEGPGIPMTLPRWAIVSDKTIQAMGLTDLLFGELSAEAGLQLVERELLTKVTGELELSSLLAASEAAERLRLGEIVKADLLLFVSQQGGEQNEHVRVVISETRYGARLESVHLPHDQQTLPALAHKIAEQVANTNTKYRPGLQYIIGVSPFLCRNVERKYEPWQMGFATLLMDSLVRRRGVAVLEIEEARSIRRELELDGKPLDARVVPIFITGDYLVRIDERKSQVIDLTVRIHRSNGEETPEVVREQLEFDQVRAWLRDALPRRLFAEAETLLTLSELEQAKQLRASADTFSSFEMSEQAVALREAELLLDPDSETRAILVRDYNQWAYQRSRTPFAVLPNQTPQEKSQAERDFQERQLDLYAITVGHYEYLVQNRLINPNEAIRLFPSLHFRPMNGEMRQLVTDAFWRLYPDIPKLDAKLGDGKVREALWHSFGDPRQSRDVQAKQSVYRGQEGWVATGFQLLRHYSGEVLDRQAADDIYRFFAETVPEDDFSYYVLSWALGGRSSSRKGDVTSEEGVRLFQRLAESKREVNQLYGRCGLLAAKLKADNATWTEADLVEARELRTLAFKRPSANRIGGDLAALVQQVGSKLPDIALTDLPPAKPAPQSSTQVPQNNPTAPVSFKEIPGIIPDWLGVKAYPPSVDLCWSERAVSLMRQRGQLEPIYSKSNNRDEVSDACWDGKYVWIGTHQAGIRAVLPDGLVAVTFGADEGLPEYNRADGMASGWDERSVVLHPIRPGHCVAAGTSGSQRRPWFAELSVEAGETLVRVFHSANKEIATSADDNDPQERFTPAWYSTDLESKWLYVGRKSKELRPPLAVNLRTLDVSVADSGVSAGIYDQAFAVGDNLYALNSNGIYRASHDNAPAVSGKLYEIWHHASHPFNAVLDIDSKSIYMPGQHWFRFDTTTDELEYLGELPRTRSYEHYGRSTHFGMIAWNRSKQLYEVSIESSGRKKVQYNWLLPVGDKLVQPPKPEEVAGPWKQFRITTRAIEPPVQDARAARCFGTDPVTGKPKLLLVWTDYEHSAGGRVTSSGTMQRIGFDGGIQSEQVIGFGELVDEAWKRFVFSHSMPAGTSDLPLSIFYSTQPSYFDWQTSKERLSVTSMCWIDGKLYCGFKNGLGFYDPATSEFTELKRSASAEPGQSGDSKNDYEIKNIFYDPTSRRIFVHLLRGDDLRTCEWKADDGSFAAISAHAVPACSDGELLVGDSQPNADWYLLDLSTNEKTPLQGYRMYTDRTLAAHSAPAIQVGPYLVNTQGELLARDGRHYKYPVRGWNLAPTPNGFVATSLDGDCLVWNFELPELPVQTEVVDLLSRVDVARDTINGDWQLARGRLTSARPRGIAKLHLPHELPESFRLRLVATPKRGSNLLIPIATGGAFFYIGIDHTRDGEKFRSGIGAVDTKGIINNATGVQQRVLLPDQENAIVITVRPRRIEVEANGSPIASFDGEFSRLTPERWMRSMDWPLTLACEDSSYEFSEIVLTPLEASKN